MRLFRPRTAPTEMSGDKKITTEQQKTIANKPTSCEAARRLNMGLLVGPRERPSTRLPACPAFVPLGNVSEVFPDTLVKFSWPNALFIVVVVVAVVFVLVVVWILSMMLAVLSLLMLLPAADNDSRDVEVFIYWRF